MKITVSDSARALGILHPVVAVIRGIAHANETPREILDIAEKELTSSYHRWEDRTNEPEISGFRDLFKAMGYNGLVPAGERLVQTFGSKGIKSYSPLVDAYNTIALRYCAGIGMHDESDILGDIHIDRATGAERITPLFKNKEVSLKKGDLFYRDDVNVLAWLGKRDVDSDNHKVQETTKSVLMVVLGNRFTSLEHNIQIVRDFGNLIRLFSPNYTLQLVT